MGGERETFLEKKDTATTSGSVASASGSRVRIHQNVGEVHFHDDASQLKCAVPVAEWWKAWEKLRVQPGKWEWIDSTNGTHLMAETVIKSGLDAHGKATINVDTLISISQVVVGTNYRELSNFTKKK